MRSRLCAVPEVNSGTGIERGATAPRAPQTRTRLWSRLAVPEGHSGTAANRSSLAVFAIGVVVLSMLAMVSTGCGSKRPPATAGGTARATPPPSEPGAGHGGQPVDSGPDVRPLDDESAQGRDLATGGSGLDGEGGPLADVFFGYDAADLSDEARATLARHAQWLQAHPGVKVTIEGHCDERGTVDYNLALGDQRARAVHDYLVSLGVPAARLSSVSLGKERPLDSGHDEAAWARNRRAHFAVGR